LQTGFGGSVGSLPGGQQPLQTGFGGLVGTHPGGGQQLPQTGFGGWGNSIPGASNGSNLNNSSLPTLLQTPVTTNSYLSKQSSDPSLEFGDFQTQDEQTMKGANILQTQSTVPKKWGDVSTLVDLGGLKTNIEKKQAEDVHSGLADRQNTTAFAGLDGFGGPARPMSLGGLSGPQFQQSMMMRNSAMQAPFPGGMTPQQGNYMMPQQGGMMGQQMGLNSMQGSILGQQRGSNSMQGGVMPQQTNSMTPQGGMNSQQNSMFAPQGGFIPQQGGFGNSFSGLGSQGFF
jgi:hypothetical protein